MPEEEFFDWNEEYKPPTANVLAIRKGMSFAEIVEKIGRPHWYGIAAATFRWNTREGARYDLQFMFNDNYNKDKDGFKIVNYYRYGIAINNPMDVDFDYSANLTEEQFFNLNEEYKPPTANVLAIRKGMSFSEIIGKIGRPHQWGRAIDTLQWNTGEGKTYEIQFFYGEDSSQDKDEAKMIAINKYGIALSNPMDIDFDYSANMTEEQFFDWNEEYKPPTASVLAIKDGMSFAEIVEKIGRPHWYGTIAAGNFRWNTKEGVTYNIQFLFDDSYNQDRDGFNLVNYYKYGIACSNPVDGNFGLS